MRHVVCMWGWGLALLMASVALGNAQEKTSPQNDIYKETLVRGIPCGDALAKLSVLESCKELEAFFQHWEPLAQQCHPGAMTLIGLKFYPHDKTRDKAPAYFRKAASLGFPQAQWELGHLYELGSVVPKDLVQAHLWYSLAFEGGYQDAGKSLKKIEGRLSQKELERSELLRSQWQPSSCTPPAFPTEEKESN